MPSEPVAALRGVTRRFDAVDGARPGQHRLPRGRGPRAARGERQRQVDRRPHPHRRPRAERGQRRHRRAGGVSFSSPRAAIAAGHRRRLPGERARPSPDASPQNVVLGHERKRLGVLRPRQPGRRGGVARGRSGSTVSPGARVGALSVAEQQLVAIAKALSLQARVLILDEPTAALNGVEVEHLIGLVGPCATRGLADHLHHPPPGGGRADRRHGDGPEGRAGGDDAPGRRA